MRGEKQTRRTVQIRLSSDMAQRLDKISARFDLGRATVLKVALARYLPEIEHYLEHADREGTVSADVVDSHSLEDGEGHDIVGEGEGKWDTASPK